MSENSTLIWIGAVLAVVIGGIVWFLRGKTKYRVSEIELSAGPVKAKLEPEKPESDPPPADSASVNITGNVMAGGNTIDVGQPDTNVAENVMLGENVIAVGAKPEPKPARKKSAPQKKAAAKKPGKKAETRKTAKKK